MTELKAHGVWRATHDKLKMSFTAQDVKTLREKTGAGMMDCKKALTEANGSFEEAIEVLKKQGLAKAVKKGDRIAAEGLIFSKVSDTAGTVLELNCETDFVSKNDDFINLGKELLEIISAKNPATVEAVMDLSIGGVTVQEKINTIIAKIGEKISLRRFQTMTAQVGSKIALYNHAGGRISVLIQISGDKVTEDVAREIAMQVAAMSPTYIDKTEVPRDILDKEKVIQMEQLKESGKPVEILEKILVGKLDKFAGEMSLMQQTFVKDPSGKKTVGTYLKEVDAAAKVVQFVRYAVGEGIEKRKDDFAEEVKNMAS